MSAEHKGEFLIYGDFPRIFDLQVRAKLDDAGKLWEKARDLEKSLVIGFVSFVLAKAGFHIGTVFKWEKRYTTDFQDDDWIESIFFSNLLLASVKVLAPQESSARRLWSLNQEFTWSQHYENTKTKEMLHVVFVSKIPSYFSANWRTDPGTGKIMRLIVKWLTNRDSEGDFPIAYGIDPSIRSYIVVHPVTVRLARKNFWKEFNEVRNSLAEENISLVTTDEFVHKLIPDKQKKYVVLENWVSIRASVLEQLYIEWPILVAASKGEQLANVSILFRRAYAQYLDRHFDYAVRDWGMACETLLAILYSMHTGKEPESNMTFHDLLCSVANMIEEKFGRNVLNDLVFIKDWRNKVSHPPTIFPTEEATLQVMRRGELFYELFKGIFKPIFLE